MMIELFRMFSSARVQATSANSLRYVEWLTTLHCSSFGSLLRSVLRAFSTDQLQVFPTETLC